MTQIIQQLKSKINLGRNCHLLPVYNVISNHMQNFGSIFWPKAPFLIFSPKILQWLSTRSILRRNEASIFENKNLAKMAQFWAKFWTKWAISIIFMLPILQNGQNISLHQISAKSANYTITSKLDPGHNAPPPCNNVISKPM